MDVAQLLAPGIRIPAMEQQPVGNISPEDLDRVVRTVIGEAANEGPAGWQAVAAVIRNRANQSGLSPSQVVLAPNQFEPWGSRRAELEGLDANSPQYQQVAQAVHGIFSGAAEDPTGGATHFYSPTSQAALGRRPPSWDNGTGSDIGRHRFFNLGYTGSGAHGTDRPQGRSGMDENAMMSLLGGPQTVPVATPPPTAAPPAPTAAAAPGEDQSWGGWLQRPENRAMMMQMGIQLMMPSWGNVGAQFGQALGAGAEAQAGTLKAQSDEAARQQQLAEPAANRANQLQVANIGAQSRENVANIRGEFSLERAMTQAGVRAGTQDAQIFRSIYQTTLNNLQRENREGALLGRTVLTDEQIAARAEAMATQSFRAQRGVTAPPAVAATNDSGVRPPGSPGTVQPGSPPPANSAIPGDSPEELIRSGRAPRYTGDPNQPANERLRDRFMRGTELLTNPIIPSGKGTSQVVPVQPTPPRGQTPPVSPAPAPTAPPSWEQLLGDPRMEQALQNQQFRQQLLQRRPDLANQLRAYEQLLGTPSGQ